MANPRRGYSTIPQEEALKYRREFEKHFEKGKGCWFWNQYGPDLFNCHPRWLMPTGRTEATHRFAYALYVASIPNGMVIDHICSNYACVNPDHLECVTQGENSRRGAPLTVFGKLLSEWSFDQRAMHQRELWAVESRMKVWYRHLLFQGIDPAVAARFLLHDWPRLHEMPFVPKWASRPPLEKAWFGWPERRIAA